MRQVDGFKDGIWLVTRSPGEQRELPETREIVPTEAATGALDAWFPDGPGEGSALYDVAASLGLIPDSGFAPPTSEGLKVVLRQALESGQLRAVKLRVAAPSEQRARIDDEDPNEPPSPTQKVNPLIDVDPVVLVKRPYTSPKRRPVRALTDIGFDGTGKLTRSSDAIDLYDAPEGGKKLAFDGKDNEIPGDRLSSGVTFWAEGVKPSGAPDDVVFELTLSGGSKPVGPPAKEKATALELTLEIHGSRPEGGGEPVALATPQKHDEGRYLLAQKPNPHTLDGTQDDPHERAKVVVKKAKPEAWAGELVLSGGAKLRLFAKEKPEAGEAPVALALTLPNADVPADGQVLWAEGSAASAALRDGGLRLGAKDVDEDGDRVTATVLKVELDICHARTAAAGDPAPLSPADKIAKGRALHVQDAGKNHGRAMLVVKKVVPEAFAGTLLLRPLDAKVAVYDVEDPKAGAKQAEPLEIPVADIPAEGKKLWAQGETKSGALRDTGFRLSVKDHLPRDGDRVNCSVVAITKVKLTIKSTPPNTARPGFPAPLDHEKEVTDANPDFAANTPLVLMRGAQPDILLEATVEPLPGNLADLPIRWQAIRNEDDAAALGGEASVPVLRADPKAPNDPRRALMDVSAKGSFRVRPFFPATPGGKYSKHDKEPSLPLLLVLADATLVADASTVNAATLSAAISPGGLRISNGEWNAGLPGAGMAMDLTADVTGGGADGRLGLDRVFAGFINDLANVDIVATYTDATVVPAAVHPLRNVYVTNRAAATGAIGGTGVFKAGDPAPDEYAYPILDTGRNPGGDGGNTATMTRSQVVNRVDRPVGQRWRITCIDSPGRGFQKNHPIFPAAVLTGVHYHHQFRGAFSFWTNWDLAEGATGALADRVYSVLRIVPWQVTGDWTTDFSVDPPVLTVVNGHTGNNGGQTIDPLGRAQDHGLEVRPPSGITTGIAWDGRV